MTVPPNPRHRKLVEGLSPQTGGELANGRAAMPVTPITVPFRIGHGYDIHKLQPEGKLRLAGVQVSDQMSPIAHSDGDVVIHAIVDARLGAMAWGDIGEQFPDTDVRWKGAGSTIFLRTIHDRVIQAGYQASNVDITIMAERPRLAPFKTQMIQSLQSIVGAGCLVNIKAGTNEGCDAVGRGEAIAAHAVVLLAQMIQS